MFLTNSRWFLPLSTLSGGIARLDRGLGDLFGDLVEGSACDSPAVNIWADSEGAVVTSELPGVKMEDLEVTASGSEITIKGVRKAGRPESDTEVRTERPDGEFERSIELPFQVDAGKIEAKLSNGVLRLEVPRAEADKPRRITVSVN